MGRANADNDPGKSAWLDYATVTWHACAAVAAIGAGFLANSIALMGFGLANVIQTAAAALALRRLQLISRGETGKEEQSVDQRILFILGVTFFFLSLFILHESGSKLFYKEKPQISKAGIVISVLTFIVTCVLTVLKLRANRTLQSRMRRNDAKENAIGGYPSLMLLFGLSLHKQYGWWWADPLAALFVLPFVIREGWKAIEDSKSSPFAATKII